MRSAYTTLHVAAPTASFREFSVWMRELGTYRAAATEVSRRYREPFVIAHACWEINMASVPLPVHFAALGRGGAQLELGCTHRDGPNVLKAQF